MHNANKAAIEAQSFSVKRAEVEFHSFASFGEPEKAMGKYNAENKRRLGLLRHHADFYGCMTPFLEIGANVGHTSYMLVNEFGEQGIALDLSADALRNGRLVMERLGLEREPLRMAGDALHLPFKDNSLRMVLAFQMLSQFQDIDAVLAEAKRVLQPGGIFVFAEEPIRRLLSLRLYRAPYWEQMNAWERKLHEWGLLGFLTKDVIGAEQEESFGIRQNHRTKLWQWVHMIDRHFADRRLSVFVPQRGWGERWTYEVLRWFDKHKSEWLPARFLGGTLAAFCRKAGEEPEPDPRCDNLVSCFSDLLKCPDCGGAVSMGGDLKLACTECDYTAANEDGVYNLLRSEDRRELYPGLRSDVIDFSMDDCSERLIEGFDPIEGIVGNRYRWINERAVFRLTPVRPGQRRLRLRGFCGQAFLSQPSQPKIEVLANGVQASTHTVTRPGLFVVETDLPEATDYEITVLAGPSHRNPPDERWLTFNLSLMRLID
ncbi:MAG: class I SAM-dependent methyltransferase [Bryobacteraceae bacterium]|nr:class I SAM-dependent methyltransferase [Bryobacteraceae bacterium]